MNAITRHAGNAPATFEPQSFGELMEFSKALAHSELVPKDYRGKPANVLVAVQWGREIGLSPLQALQNISLINGRPAVWGDAALALCLASPVCEFVRETFDADGTARCEAKRRGQEPVFGTFNMEDAKRAGLASKDGPWKQYPQRMLKLRARGFALRDAFPDVLRGLVTAEEAQDTPADLTPQRKQEATRVVGIAQPRTALPAPSPRADMDRTLDGDTIPALDPELPPPGSMREEAARIQGQRSDTPAQALIKLARQAETIADGGNLLSVWASQAAALEALRGTDAWAPLEREMGAGLKRSLGSDPAAAFVAALRATTAEHLDTLQECMEGRWADTLDAMQEEVPATFTALRKHVAAQIARVRGAVASADLPMDGHPSERAADARVEG